MNGTKLKASTQRNQRRQLRSLMASERQVRNNFYFFELGFIFVVIPVLVIAVVIGPTLQYFAITQKYHLWPFFVISAIIVFFEVLAIQYYLKRFYLDPHNMTLGEFLRFKFDSRFKRSEFKEMEQENNISWYDDLDEFIRKIRLARKEKTDWLYATAYDQIDFDDK